MEHHPIPQDITGFQFKLIGEMTVKQFAYLAAGAILTVVALYAPVFVFLKFILVPMGIGLGAALAFLPVEGRPLDTMLTYYIKALLSPTQYIYQKTGRAVPAASQKPQLTPQAIQRQPAPVAPPIPPSQQPAQPLSDFLSTVHEQNKQAAASSLQSQVVIAPMPAASPTPQVMIQQPTPQPEVQASAMLNSYAFQGPQIVSMHGADENKPLPPLPEETLPAGRQGEEKVVSQPETVVKAEAQLEQKELILEKELVEAKLAEAQQQTTETSKAAHEKTLALQDQLHEIAAQKAQLEQEIMNLKRQLSASHAQVHTTQVAASQPSEKPVSQQVRQVPQAQAKAAGLPQVNDPNIIAGVIKDPRGNVLPNILVEILDSQNNPVRAFKTNQVGQFLSATPLPNGTFRMNFEDPKSKQAFESVEIVAKGDILLPLEIISQDEREALRRELFS